jgi:hypothetical protein
MIARPTTHQNSMELESVDHTYELPRSGLVQYKLFWYRHNLYYATVGSTG